MVALSDPWVEEDIVSLNVNPVNFNVVVSCPRGDCVTGVDIFVHHPLRHVIIQTGPFSIDFELPQREGSIRNVVLFGSNPQQQRLRDFGIEIGIQIWSEEKWRGKPKHVETDRSLLSSEPPITRRFSEWQFRDWQNGGQILTYWWFSDFSSWIKRPKFFSYPSRVSHKDFSYPLRLPETTWTTPHGVFLPLAGADF